MHKYSDTFNYAFNTQYSGTTCALHCINIGMRERDPLTSYVQLHF